MGLLNLFLQNQSNLDITPTPSPGNGPINPATGEFNTGIAPFQQTWNSDNTYLDNFNPNIQPNTLGQTGLDNTNPNFIPSTTLPLNTTSYPNLSTGEFNGQSNNFIQIYSSNNTYLNTFDPQTQPDTVLQGQTGLDNTNPNFVPTTTIPIDSTQYPQFVQGEFNGAPTLYNQLYNPNNNYINTFIAGGSIGIQPQTLSETGLDIDNPNFVLTTTTPDTITQYPATALGGLGQSAVQFLQIWSPVINYNDVVVGAPTSPLEQSLDETGLDIENSNAVPTTTTPDTLTVYPPLTSGEFGGATTQYTQIYTPNNTYLNNVSIEDSNSPQISTLEQTGLDIENQDAAPTTYVVPEVDTTTYPYVEGATLQPTVDPSPENFKQIYKPTNTYLSYIISEESV